MAYYYSYVSYKNDVLDKLKNLRFNVEKNISQMDLENVTVKTEMEDVRAEMLGAIDKAIWAIEGVFFRSLV